MTGVNAVAVLAAGGILLGVGILCWAVWTLADATVTAARKIARSWRDARKVLAETSTETLGDLVEYPELDRWRAARANSQHQPCHRCRTGSTAFPCTCDHDCYAEMCAAGYTAAPRPGCPFCHGIEMDHRKCTCTGDGCERSWCPRYDTGVMA